MHVLSCFGDVSVDINSYDIFVENDTRDFPYYVRVS